MPFLNTLPFLLCQIMLSIVDKICCCPSSFLVVWLNAKLSWGIADFMVKMGVVQCWCLFHFLDCSLMCADQPPSEKVKTKFVRRSFLSYAEGQGLRLGAGLCYFPDVGCCWQGVWASCSMVDRRNRGGGGVGRAHRRNRGSGFGAGAGGWGGYGGGVKTGQLLASVNRCVLNNV
jgi:hypothetical protein